MLAELLKVRSMRSTHTPPPWRETHPVVRMVPARGRNAKVVCVRGTVQTSGLVKAGIMPCTFEVGACVCAMLPPRSDH